MPRNYQKYLYLTKGERNKLSWIKENSIDYEDMNTEELAKWLLDIKLQQKVSEIKKLKKETNFEKVLINEPVAYPGAFSLTPFAKFVNFADTHY
jgi:hypothetical protein